MPGPDGVLATGRASATMKVPVLAMAAAAVLAPGAAPAVAAPASPPSVIVGATPTVPSCPPRLPARECTLVLGHASAFDTIANGKGNVSVLTRPGVLTAGLLGVSALTADRASRARDVRYLNRTYGGPPRAVMTLLAPVGAGRNRQWVVMAQSRRFDLTASLGRVIRLPLFPSLAVLPGDVIALSTPTWAPVLRIGLSANRFAYRQSRSGRCARTPAGSPALSAFGGASAYACLYRGTSVQVAASERAAAEPTRCEGAFTLPAAEGPRSIMFDAVQVTAAAGIGCQAALHVAAKAWPVQDLRYVFGPQFASSPYGGPFHAGGFDCYLTAYAASGSRAGDCASRASGLRFVEKRAFWQRPPSGYTPPALTP